MIASIAFRNFKALRNTRIALAPFNVVIGPNGSGKTSLIEAVSQLRVLSESPPVDPAEAGPVAEGPSIAFSFGSPHEAITARLGCRTDGACDALWLDPPHPPGWPALRQDCAGIRAFSLDHAALAAASRRSEGVELAANGARLGAVLARLRADSGAAYAALTGEMLRIAPEFRELEITEAEGGMVEFGLRLADNDFVPAAELAQGMLYLLGVLVLAFEPQPPRVVCIEEVDRGIHPRMLREIRDALYRLSYPRSPKDGRCPVQVIATTHSPYFIDLFRTHPEEVVISQKHGCEAKFERLADRPDLPELLSEGSLGDMWFSGILGGVPEER